MTKMIGFEPAVGQVPHLGGGGRGEGRGEGREGRGGEGRGGEGGEVIRFSSRNSLIHAQNGKGSCDIRAVFWMC